MTIVINNYDDPDLSLYSLGAELIQILRASNKEVHDSTLLYLRFKEKLQLDLSFTVYLYVLDWLYIIGIIVVDDRGDIKNVIA